MPAEKFIMPRLATTPALPADGIYFDMSFEDYLAAPAVGSGLLRDGLTDPLLAWARSWLNPRKEEKKADHFLYGKAFHCRLLEGSDEFAARYYVEPDKGDYKVLYVTDADVKAALEEFEIKPKSGNKDVRVAQLREVWPDAPIWDDIVLESQRANIGKDAIKADWAHNFEQSGIMVENNPDLLPLVSEGYSEVSIFWHCPRTGIPKKARFDKLQITGVVDVKTFANTHEKSLKRAIPKAIANEQYPFQISHYLEGAQVVRDVVRKTGADAVFQAPDKFDSARLDFAQAWSMHDEPDVWHWLFVQKGDAPTVMGVKAPVDGIIREQFDLLCEDASRVFLEMAQEFGPEPWAPMYGIWELEDNQLPAYTMEI